MREESPLERTLRALLGHEPLVQLLGDSLLAFDQIVVVLRVLIGQDAGVPLILMVWVGTWSDGTPAPAMAR
jgi:hypothetical protein